MKQSRFVTVFGIVCVAWTAHGANATSPVDYTQRNTTVAPGSAPTIVPGKQSPQTNSTLQDKRVGLPVVEKATSGILSERAAIDLKETQEKVVLEKDSRRPEKRDQPTSEFNHRPARIATNADTTKPAVVTKYQESLAAASAANMARFPALDGATTAKVNRFVFRRNPPDTIATDGKNVTPAAGGSAIQK